MTDTRRFHLLPLKNPEIYEFYHLFKSLFWTPAEVDTSKDRAAYLQLDPEAQTYLRNILAFFYASDSIVAEQLFKRLMDVEIPEARLALAMQLSQEAIHTEMYASLIQDILTEDEKDDAFHALDRNPTVRSKADFCLKYIADEDLTLAERYVVSGAMEGVLFSASFCVIFWLKSHRKPVLEGLSLGNLFIARDEGSHCKLSAAIHNALPQKCSQARAHQIFAEAVRVETEFVRDSMPVASIGMNCDQMIQFIKLSANVALALFGFDALYPGVQNPFPFMDSIGLSTKQNFFEGRSSEYQMATGKRAFSTDEEF